MRPRLAASGRRLFCGRIQWFAVTIRCCQGQRQDVKGCERTIQTVPDSVCSRGKSATIQGILSSSNLLSSTDLGPRIQGTFSPCCQEPYLCCQASVKLRVMHYSHSVKDRRMSYMEEKRLDEVVKYLHDKACDRDMCHPNCPYRKSCQAADRWYPGIGRTRG